MRWDLNGQFECPECNGSGICEAKIPAVVADMDDDITSFSFEEKKKYIIDEVGIREICCDLCKGNGVVEIELSEDGYQYVTA